MDMASCSTPPSLPPSVGAGPPIDEVPHPDDVVPPPSEVVDRLFEAGRDAQAEQARALEALFDRYWKDGPHTMLTGGGADAGG